MIVHEEGATPWMRDMAHDILELLTVVYPGHPWSVNVYGDSTGGGYFIRHLDFPANWGQNQPQAHLFGSASELRADVLRKGGELLERCSLARKRWDETPIKRMEGVPEKYQPEPDVSKLPAIHFDTVIATAEREMRDAPRPQALELAKK